MRAIARMVGGVRYRVEEIAARCGVSVDTVRFYQSRRLLPPPAREGRVAWYGDEHVERLDRIRDLKAQGFTLAMVARVLSGELDGSGQALAVALADPGGREQPLDLAELAGMTGLSPTLLEALERQGLLVGRTDDERPYTTADAEAVRAGVALLQAGVPLSELLALAREHDAAVQAVARSAVDLFARYVRAPAQATATSDEDATARMVDALGTMLPAVDTVVSHHFRRRLVGAARERMGGARLGEGAAGDRRDDDAGGGAVEAGPGAA